jgi:hypothetical protein
MSCYLSDLPVPFHHLFPDLFAFINDVTFLLLENMYLTASLLQVLTFFSLTCKPKLLPSLL